MRSNVLRRTAASLGVALCLSLLHVPAASAVTPHAVPAHSRQAHAQPASHSVLTSLWNLLVTVITGNPPADLGSTDPNVEPTADLGATADPNGAL